MKNDILTQKLNGFIRKYYKNQMLKGAILVLGFLVMSYLLVILLEYFGRFSTQVRTALFFGFCAVNAGIFAKYIFVPLAHLLKIGKTLSYEQAAVIVGDHFLHIKDKLLNTLQLQNQQKNGQNDLLEQAITQRTAELYPLSFTKVINFGENKKYLKYAVLPLVAFLGLYVAAPAIVNDGTQRLVNYNTKFEPKAPFDFLIQNQSLSAIQGQDLDLKISIDGAQLPDQAYIVLQNNKYKLDKINKTKFEYAFKNLQKEVSFQFFADGFYSQNYKISVLPKPIISNFDVELDYPAYTNKKDETISNAGDFAVPAGTKVKWVFNTQNVARLELTLGGVATQAQKYSDQQFVITKIPKQSTNYSIKTANQFTAKTDSLGYTLSVAPDLFPQINASVQPDSLNPSAFYYAGDINDDYGFTKLVFKYRKQIKDTETSFNTQNIAIENDKATKQLFFYAFDFATLNLQPGEAIEYYFEVMDNDAVNGSKAARTTSFEYKLKSIEALKQEQEQNSSEIKDEMQQAIDEAKKIQKDLKKLENKLFDKKELSYEDKKQFENMMQRNQKMQQQMQNANELNKENLKNQQQQNPTDQSIFEKQQQLQQLFEKVLNEDIKKTIAQIEKLMKEAAKKEDLEKLQMNNKQVERELERMLDFYKQLEVESKLQESLEKLEKIAEEQQKESEKNQQNNEQKNPAEQAQKDQKNLNEKFDEVKKDIAEAEQKNEELKEPMEMPETKDAEKEVDKKQDDAQDKLNGGDKKGAAKDQKDAAEEMKKMAESIKNKMQSQKQEALEMDIKSLRMILENLVKASFRQEDLINRLKENTTYSPVYIKIAQEQQKLKEDTRLIEDSLVALSRRIMALQSYITKEMGSINLNLAQTTDALEDRYTDVARTRQQYTMTSYNNLAVMLSEMLQKMQEQKAEGDKPGSGSCNKPGSGKGKKPSLGKLNQMQKGLNKQMKDGKDKGQSPGKTGKDGKTGSMGMGGMSSSQYAQMVAQQQAIRQELQRITDEQTKNGAPTGELRELAKKMEQTETELLNKQITNETLNRQQEIMTRLLESEKAQQEREQDNQRKSNTAQDQSKPTPPNLEKFKQQKLKEFEQYKTAMPNFNPFYKAKVEQYLIQVNQ